MIVLSNQFKKTVLFILLFLCHQLAWAAEHKIEKSIFVKELNQSIAVFPTVYAPNVYNQPMRQFLNDQDLRWAKDVLEIGTGTGVLSLIALRKGAGHVIGTDINLEATANSIYNSEKLGYKNNFDSRLVPLSSPGAFVVIKKHETFDLIISNPPWFEGKPKTIEEYAVYDSEYKLLYSLIDGLDRHLKKNGKAWLEIGSYDALDVIKQEAEKRNLKVKFLLSQGYQYSILEISKK